MQKNTAENEKRMGMVEKDSEMNRECVREPEIERERKRKR